VIGTTMKTLPLCVLLAVSVLACAQDIAGNGNEDGFVAVFNGKDLNDWDLKIRSGDAELATKVFSVDNGTLHVLKDFPAEFQLNAGINNTHGMCYTKKKYSKFIFRFEYKWGKTIANNFSDWQYDAGMYYHVTDTKIWPTGIEYQVRYDHLKGKNHTGDIWAYGIQWYADDSGQFCLPQNGGKPMPIKRWSKGGPGGEHLALGNAEYHALDDQWNLCEVIVMSDQYAIHKLNGKIVNFATDLSKSEGVIGMQSETAEIFYRNMRIKEFSEVVPLKNILSLP